jgi:hypothetical protein
MVGKFKPVVTNCAGELDGPQVKSLLGSAVK